jgi:uridine kinase
MMNSLLKNTDLFTYFNFKISLKTRYAILLNLLFVFGCVIKLGLIFTLSPLAITQWYAPFLATSVSAFNFDPWSLWVAHGGNMMAFPYGYMMWFCFLPLTLLCKFLGIKYIYGYSLTIFCADFFLLYILRRILVDRDLLLLIMYWLSPIIIVASYCLGFNDIIPILFLIIALYNTKNLNFIWSGFFLCAAISAKLSMLLAVPFFLIYLKNNRAIRHLAIKFIQGLVLGGCVLLLPFFIFSSSGINMLLHNPEMSKIFQLSLHFGNNTQLYLLPIAYCCMLYAAWRISRLNFTLFTVILGLAFLLIVLMTPPVLGWFIWALPIFMTDQVTRDRVTWLLISVLTILYVFVAVILHIPHTILPQFLVTTNFSALLHTCMFTIGIILAWRIWRESIRKNDYFRLSRKPFVLGIAGDSGSGKDTFAAAMMKLFGSFSVTHLSGDDYHLWDRQKPMWNVVTHLNPVANDLEGFTQDLLALTDGKKVYSKHYDHQTGRMSRPLQIKSNDLIIASGLHALYLPLLRDCYNLSVYLDIDEELRKYFKIQRDIYTRGHTMEKVLASFAKREHDAKKFIRPQLLHADLVFAVKPLNPQFSADQPANLPLKLRLVVRSKNGLNEMSLTRMLIGICGLHVDLLSRPDEMEVEMIIEGDIVADDLVLVAQMLCPEIFEFLDISPQWDDGVLGLMQLITLLHMHQALIKRFI